MTQALGHRPLRIIVTGPESTGKSTLARRVADLLDAELVPEAARIYAERLTRPLTAEDVEPIARAHVASSLCAEARAMTRGARAVVYDTDLASTIVYADYYYALSVDWITRAAAERRGDLYLLCDVDVPWIADGIRDQPDDRAAMFEHFERILRALGAHVAVVRGDWEERWRTAVTAVEKESRRYERGN